MAPLITLLTDFGTSDSYVAEVKAVLLSRALGAALVDVTHQIPPGDVRAGQYVLARVWHRFPEGTVHLVVVDPGVGTSRRALAAQAAGHYFVAPDNGVLSPLPAVARFVVLAAAPGAGPRVVLAARGSAASSSRSGGARGRWRSGCGTAVRRDCWGSAWERKSEPRRSPPLESPRRRGNPDLRHHLVGEIRRRREPRELCQFPEELALPLGRGEAVGALREVDRAGGAEQAHGPLLDFIRGQVSGVRCGGHLGPALRARARTGFIPAGPGDGPAIRCAHCGYTSSP